MRFEVKDGGFGYPREECIFSHVDFIMDKPEVMSVLGANGAGKTTLLKCMLGLLEWKTGGTYIDGISIKEIPYHQLWQKIGYVPQAKASAFAYHAEDMVLLGRNAHLGTFGQPKKADREIALACMEEIGIGYLKGRLCSRISGGELQMVLIARALAADPSILVLDEPESNLDMKNQLRILDSIECAAREMNTACLINTHFPNHALNISDQTLMLGPGQKKLFGATKDLINEGNIERFFSVRSKIVSFQADDQEHRTIFPYRIASNS